MERLHRNGSGTRGHQALEAVVTVEMAVPKVTVVMPVYNGERFLRGSLDSVVDQAFQDFEMLCVDDGSTDNSAAVLEQYGDRSECRAKYRRDPSESSIRRLPRSRRPLVPIEADEPGRGSRCRSRCGPRAL